MEIIKRNKGLTNNIESSQEKIKIVLSWIREFKFTNIKIIEILLGLDSGNVRTLIKKMTEKGLISIFKNKNLDGKNYFYGITQLGLEYLLSHGLLDGDIKNKDISSLQKSMKIVHDLVVQKYIAENLELYKEVFAENTVRLSIKLDQILPDAVVVLKTGERIAIEYERWAKAKDRIFFNFYRHYENIFIHDLYDGCIYLFENETINNTYKTIFEMDHWTRYKQNKFTSKLYILTETFNTNKDQNIKDAFILKTYF